MSLSSGRINPHATFYDSADSALPTCVNGVEDVHLQYTYSTLESVSTFTVRGFTGVDEEMLHHRR